MTQLKVVGNPKHRRYTRRQKATAVMAATLTSSVEASETTGIPRKTIAYWLDDPEFAALRQKTRTEMAEGFTVLAQLAQARLRELLPVMEPRDLVILLGVSTDKGQLLSGQATDRTEHRELLNDFDDHEREQMTEWLKELARQRIGDAVGS